MTTPRRRPRKAFVACRADELPPGSHRIVTIEGKGIGLYHVGDRYYALHNRCPHMGGPLCEGPHTGTTLPADNYRFVYGREGYIIRCGWHGWEFDLETGQALVDARTRARTYQVTVENGDVIIHI